ncbi:hypothetical protein AK812_SmicGene16468 [Symbiodinium microadriaticum]|uniref:Uncharacterized protein n=1 Tax=Symbiodinium microadriaticum TaxID=2951 RepID=A0A1Q9E072_SYMMI|nr:hypothetical protein AK812_SmicGene16468 [Symbiodinium microadriaticum]
MVFADSRPKMTRRWPAMLAAGCRLRRLASAPTTRDALRRGGQSVGFTSGHCRRLEAAHLRFLGPRRVPGLAAPFSTSSQPSQEERIASLEKEVSELRQKLAEVEKVAKRKGFIAMMMEYGAPFALWYAFCWGGSLVSLYFLLEYEVVSWQESLKPFFQGLGLDSYTDRIDASTGNMVIAFMVQNSCPA